MITIKDIIFDKDEYGNRKEIWYFSNNIKKLDNVIKVIKIFQLEAIGDFYLDEVLEIDLTLSVTLQA